MGFNEDFDTIMLSPNRGGASGTVVALCFHDEEYPEIGTAAEDTGRFFSRSSSRASTTGCIDNNSKVGCVPYGITAWHTGGGSPWNDAIEGYEHSGYASQSREQWIDVYGLQMLELSAAHFAKRCHILGIPPRKINHVQLRQAVLSRRPDLGGICGHKDMTDAIPVQYGHYDPGPNFPWDYYIARVQHFHGGGNPDQQIITTPAQPVIPRSTSVSYAYKIHDKPTIWTTEKRMDPTSKVMYQWYVPVADAVEISSMLRSGEITAVRPLGVGPEKGGSPDYDAAFEHARVNGRVVGA